MPGGVAGAQPIMAAPYADLTSNVPDVTRRAWLIDISRQYTGSNNGQRNQRRAFRSCRIGAPKRDG